MQLVGLISSVNGSWWYFSLISVIEFEVKFTIVNPLHETISDLGRVSDNSRNPVLIRDDSSRPDPRTSRPHWFRRWSCSNCCKDEAVSQRPDEAPRRLSCCLTWSFDTQRTNRHRPVQVAHYDQTCFKQKLLSRILQNRIPITYFFGTNSNRDNLNFCWFFFVSSKEKKNRKTR